MATVKLPTPSELVAVGKQLGMNLSDHDVAFFLETMTGSVAAYGPIAAIRRLNPHPRGLLRNLRDEADPRPRALHGRSCPSS